MSMGVQGESWGGGGGDGWGECKNEHVSHLIIFIDISS